MCTTNHQSTNEYGKLYSEVVVLGFMEMAYVMAKSEDAERIKELETALLNASNALKLMCLIDKTNTADKAYKECVSVLTPPNGL